MNFNALAVKTSADLNGDAKMTADDQFGLACQDALEAAIEKTLGNIG